MEQTNHTAGHEARATSAEPRGRRIKSAGLVGAAVSSVVALSAVSAGPVLGFISYNHNETLVTSPEPIRRRVRTAGVVAATAAAVSAAAVGATSATSVLAYISLNHNETLAGSAG
jgi:hypothetical protein